MALVPLLTTWHYPLVRNPLVYYKKHHRLVTLSRYKPKINLFQQKKEWNKLRENSQTRIQFTSISKSNLNFIYQNNKFCLGKNTLVARTCGKSTRPCWQFWCKILRAFLFHFRHQKTFCLNFHNSTSIVKYIQNGGKLSDFHKIKQG